MESDEGSPEDGTITIDTTGFNASAWASVYAGGGSGTLPISNGTLSATSYNYATMTQPKYNGGLMVNGDADFQGDVKIKGRSIVDTLTAIEQRLSILTPDPKKLAKYEALQKAYAHYKTIEAMCYGDDDE